MRLHEILIKAERGSNIRRMCWPADDYVYIAVQVVMQRTPIRSPGPTKEYGPVFARKSSTKTILGWLPDSDDLLEATDWVEYKPR